MRRVFGLLLLGPTEKKTSIPPHEISLLGKPLRWYSRAALSSVCGKVHCEVFYSKECHPGETVVKVLGNWRKVYGSRPLPSDSLIVHDVFDPLAMPELFLDIRDAILSGAAAVVTTPFVDDAFSVYEFARFPSGMLQAPIGLSVKELLSFVAKTKSMPTTLAAFAQSVALESGSPLRLMPRNSLGGRLFSDLSIDETEALLRVHANKGKRAARYKMSAFRRVLVLGATGGIGQACVRLLRESGIPVLTPTRKEIDLRYETLFSRLGEVDSVIHAAGVNSKSPEETMAVNFHSCARLLQAAETLRWKGSIVFLSSTAATFGRPGAAVYSASKAALNSLIEAESERLYGRGIRINAVAPAKVATHLQEALNPGTAVDRMITTKFVAHLVLDALGSPCYGNILYVRKGQDAGQRVAGDG